MAPPRLLPWRTLDRRETFRTPRIAVFSETVELPDGRVVDDYDQIEMPSFAVMLAQTADGQVICERQYKHGLKRVSLTLPGGQVEDGEDPLAAAKRELLEETGYACPDWSAIGTFRTHSNQGGATVHYFHATGAVQVQPPSSGDLEEMLIELLTPGRFLDAVRNDEFQVVADLAAVLMALLKSSFRQPL
ncbi:MAG TPA: NUDIX hydrolase [Patescibacteria group bacterium]|nr:NUDIX hydrolase [Patescibacteria group bacterium]